MSYSEDKNRKREEAAKEAAKARVERAAKDLGKLLKLPPEERAEKAKEERQKNRTPHG